MVGITRSSEHRARAVEVIEPLLRAQNRFEDLAQLIESGIGTIDDALLRRTELQRLAELHEQGRGRPDDAFQALCRALAEDSGEESVVVDLERLARQLGRFDVLAGVLAEQGAKAGDGFVGAGLYRRLARICEEELRDDARAIDALVKASERDDAHDTLLALDRLYERTQRWTELVDVLERQVATSTDPAARRALLLRVGALRDERLGDGRGAFVAFKELLDEHPGDADALAGMERLGRYDALANDVLNTLDECYRQVGATDKLAGLYDIRLRLAQSDAERIRLLDEAARIWEVELHDPVRALKNVRRIFEIDPSRDEALQEVERLAQAAGSFEGVRGMVEGLIESGAIEGKQKVMLALRAAEWYREQLGDAAAEERCLRWALSVDSSAMAQHDRLIALLRVPGRERELVAALRESAEADRDVPQRKTRLREAAELSAGVLADPTTAAQCYEALLGTDPDDREALSELAMVRMSQGRLVDVIALLERRLTVEDDSEVRIALRLRIGEIQEQDVGDDPQAIAAYRQLLAEAPSHPQALTALQRLYDRNARWNDLCELLAAQVGSASSAEARAELRLRLAKLYEERLNDGERAIGELLQVASEAPEHEDVKDELERLYAALSRFDDLVALLSRRAARASDAGNVEMELTRLRRMAAVFETQLGDAGKATETYLSIHARAPSDADALSALVRLQLAAQRWPDAAQSMRALLALQTGEPALTLALSLSEIADQRLGDVELAESALLDAKHKNPQGDELRQRLKALYEKHKAHAKLVQVLIEEEAQTTDAAPKLALLNRIAALYQGQLGDAGNAVAYLERAAALVPDDRDTLLLLCDLYIAANRSRDAIPVLEKIVASYGGRRAKEVATYQHRLGQAYEGLGELEGALAKYDAAFKIDLTSVAILRDLGRLCLNKGDLDRAQKTYRALLLQKLGPDAGIAKADVYYCLGEISHKQGDKVKAKAMLERAIAEAGAHAQASALLATL